MTPAMGSFVYAQQALDRGERIHGMISLEMVGYFNETEGSQAFRCRACTGCFPIAGTSSASSETCTPAS